VVFQIKKVTYSLLNCNKMKKKLLLLTTLISIHSVWCQDWNGIAVPPSAGTNMVWQLQPQSDDFNYTSVASPKTQTFLDKWDDFYHNAWVGPGLTIWNRAKSLVEDGTLKIPSTRINNNNVSTGCITSRQTIVYPAYVEAYAKVMSSTLASDVWLLSPDDTQEIDILEAYGDVSPTRNPNNAWFGMRVHISHHVFIRNPFTDWQPTDTGSWFNNGTVWKDGYHRFGVYWRDPWHLEYYIDGVLRRTVSGKENIDPQYHTNAVNPGDTNNDTRTGLSKPMDIIINVEDQTWRSNQGLTPTNAELLNTDDHTFKVDWIRVYKAVSNLSTEDVKANTIKIYPNPVNDVLHIDSNSIFENISIFKLNGAKIKTEISKNATNNFDVSQLPTGLYIVKAQKEDKTFSYHKIVKL
jgi:beta-agarase